MIAIILVNWNGRADTIECLESLLRLDDENFVAIVVDNGSADGSIDAFQTWADAHEPPVPQGPPWSRLPQVRQRQPRLHNLSVNDAWPKVMPGDIVVVATGDNLGFAGANNVGMALALQDDRIEYIWLLNNDTVIAPDSTARLKEAALEKPWAKIIGSRLMYYHHPDLVQGVAGFFRPWLARGGHLGHRASAHTLPSVTQIERSMSYVMGASMFLPMVTYKTVGPMSEDYFLYFEEPDWANRMGKGRTQSVALDAVVYHKEGGSIGTSSLHRPSDTSLYYLNANLLRYMWRWHRLFSPLALLRVAREALGFLVKGDKAAMRILWMAMSDRFAGRSRKGKVTVSQ